MGCWHWGGGWEPWPGGRVSLSVANIVPALQAKDVPGWGLPDRWACSFNVRAGARTQLWAVVRGRSGHKGTLPLLMTSNPYPRTATCTWFMYRGWSGPSSSSFDQQSWGGGGGGGTPGLRAVLPPSWARCPLIWPPPVEAADTKDKSGLTSGRAPTGLPLLPAIWLRCPTSDVCGFSKVKMALLALPLSSPQSSRGLWGSLVLGLEASP